MPPPAIPQENPRVATVLDRTPDYVVADLTLADFGRAEIAIAET